MKFCNANIFQIFTGFQFSSATANFKTRTGGIVSRGVNGVILSNGYFIFYWFDGAYRRMVLTKNDGTVVKAGYLMIPIKVWQDYNQWTTVSEGSYTVVNFKGGQGTLSFFLQCFLFQHVHSFLKHQCIVACTKSLKQR